LGFGKELVDLFILGFYAGAEHAYFINLK